MDGWPSVVARQTAWEGVGQVGCVRVSQSSPQHPPTRQLAFKGEDGEDGEREIEKVVCVCVRGCVCVCVYRLDAHGTSDRCLQYLR